MIYIVFFSLYWVSLPFVGNSLYLLFFFALIFRFSFFKEFFDVFKDFAINSFVFSLIFLIILSLLIGYLTKTNDYSYSWLVFRQVPYFICAVTVGFFLAKKIVSTGCKKVIEEYFLTVGWMQGSVVLMAISFPEFRLWLLPFQGSEDLDFLLLPGNLGVRGYALASQQFFGLSAMLCIQSVIILGWLVSKKEIINLSIFIKYIIFGIACIFVGRTSGIIFFICLSLMIAMSSLKQKINFLVLFGFIAAAFYFLIDFNQPVYRWAFELIFNFIDDSNLSMTSLDNLTQDMLFMPTLSQFLIGDGFYTDSEGGYYLGTDSGLLRSIIFGGINMQFLLFFPYAVMLISVVRSKFIVHERRLPLTIMIFTAIILQIKGEVLIVGTMSNVLIYLYYTYSIFEINFRSKHKN